MKSPLTQFEIKTLYQINVFGIDISFTNSALFMLLALGLMWAFLTYVIKTQRKVPTYPQALFELSYSFIAGLIKDSCGKEGLKYLPFIFSVFFYILLGNLLGMIPYAFTFTSHIIVTFALALIVFVTINVIGFMRHGLKYFSLFLPQGTPMYLAPFLIVIEVISFLSRPVSLAARLFANMMAGHMILKVFASFVVALGVWLGWVPLGMNVLFTGFEFFVALLQAYIFTVLSCIYLNEALHLH